MKILIVRTFPSYMEVKHNTYNIQEVGLAKALVRSGHNCDIVFWTHGSEREEVVRFDEGLTVTVFYRYGKSFFKNAIYAHLDSLIDKYDIVQSSEYNQLQSWILARKYPNKTVIYHGPYYSTFNKRYNIMCSFIDKFVIPTYKKNHTQFLVKSELAKNFLISKGISSDQIITTGVGVDLDVFKIENIDNIPKEVLTIKNFADKLKLLYIGRMEPRRNIMFLIDVLYALKKKNIEVKLVIIGDGDDKYCRECTLYASKMKVNDEIYWIKKVEQKYLAYVYENIDIFLLPTYYEIFGMVLLESMYFSKPVITTKNGGSEMLISQGKDGFVIDDFDAEKWCKNILMIRNNKEIGKSAHDKILNNFTWDRLYDLFFRAYKKLIDNI